MFSSVKMRSTLPLAESLEKDILLEEIQSSFGTSYEANSNA